MPQTPHSAWTGLERHTVPQTASNTSQYSGSARGSQPPEGGIFLPCCFAFLAGVAPPGHVEGKEYAHAAALLS